MTQSLVPNERIPKTLPLQKNEGNETYLQKHCSKGQCWEVSIGIVTTAVILKSSTFKHECARNVAVVF